MQAIIPHEIVYDTLAPVPVGDVIESLRGVSQLCQEIGPLLEALVPGLRVESITVQVREVSQASPLREAFAVGIIALYQEKIASDLPKVVHDLFGVDVPKEYNNIIAVLFIAMVFYAGSFAYDQAKKKLERSNLQKKYDAIISDLAKHLGRSEDSLRKLFDDRYGKGKIAFLTDSTSKVLQPSKNQGNVAIRFNNDTISKSLIAEFPSKAQIVEDEPGPTTDPLENVEIHLHAQDLDHTRQGWAAVIPALSSRRLRMFLYPPLKAVDIYTKRKIHGDVLVESNRDDKGEKIPFRIHLIRLREAL